LVIHHLTANKLGTELFYYLEDIKDKKILEHFKDVLVSKKDIDRVFPVKGHQYPHGLLTMVGGEVEMFNCKITNAVSNIGLFYLASNSKFTMRNNEISSLFGI
jgi:hypothetical protein